MREEEPQERSLGVINLTTDLGVGYMVIDPCRRLRYFTGNRHPPSARAKPTNSESVKEAGKKRREKEDSVARFA
ncbi:hypothetical protein J6590_064217 [Homalodisca vitripennis]|nr:hypothetical protein J6590_064217 [Homalodisca vitripennis]